MTSVVGVDGSRAGWMAIELSQEDGDWHSSAVLHPAFAEVIAKAPERQATVVGVPIGLPSRPGLRRRCDELARQQLGERHATVLYAPARPLLAAKAYEEVKGHGISQPAFLLTPMLAEVDAAMEPQLQRCVFQGHAEWAFQVLNGGPLKNRRQLAAGRDERLALLRRLPGDPFAGIRGVLESRPFPYRDLAEPCDLVDACAQAWIAWNVVQGTAVRVPTTPDPDARGLDRAIWGLPPSACLN